MEKLTGILAALVLVLSLHITACGGGASSESGGDGSVEINGSGLGPIVNTDGDFVSGPDAAPLNICPQDNIELLGLEIADIRNSTSVSGNENHGNKGLTVSMGDHHNPYPQLALVEPLVEIDLRVTRPTEDISTSSTQDEIDREVTIHIVFLEDAIAYDQNPQLGDPPKASNIQLNGTAITEIGNELAFFDDSITLPGPGFFDFDSQFPQLNWLDRKIIVQVCETTVDTPEGQITVSSNPLLLEPRRGFGP